MTRHLLAVAALALLQITAAGARAEDDFNASISRRVDGMLQKMSLEEKVGQAVMEIRPVPRLGIAGYDWWNECLHGVGRADTATVFPQAIGLAAMWDEPCMHEVASVISDEARAKHHEFLRRLAPAIAT